MALPEHRRLTPCERLWLACLDQACLDVTSHRRSVREDAEEWWRSDMPAILASICGVPLSALPRLRAQRGRLRVAVDASQEGRGYLKPAYDPAA